MQTPRWPTNRSGPFPPRQWNPQWPRQQHQQHHNNQFIRYNRPQQQHSFNENYWCETCDRGFPNQDLLDKHNQQHQKCNIDGCQFVAHPKVITKHIQMQHATGLYKKIGNLKNPEDIQKWIDERKKKYPTKINVEKKAAEKKEKIERGEKIGLQRDARNDKAKQGADRKRKLFDGGRQNNQKRNKTHHQNHNGSFKTNNEVRKKGPAPRKDPQPVSQATEDSDSRKLKHFTGIRNLIMDSDNEEDYEQGPLLSDDEVEMEETVKNEPKVCDALSSLISNYDSSEEEAESNDKVIVKSKTESSESKTLNVPAEEGSIKLDEIVQHNNCSDNESGPEEVTTTKSKEEAVVTPHENDDKQVKVQGNRKLRNDYKQSNKINLKKRTKPKPPSTLLQKLLHREIQQERNIILQCVNYIVKHNYFDKSQ